MGTASGSTMNLSSRVRSLERKRGLGVCPICKGMGRLVFTNETCIDGPSYPPLIGCEGCGDIYHIRLVATPRPLPGTENT